MLIRRITFLRRHELIDSEPQWREAQKRKGEGVQKAIVSTPIVGVSEFEYKITLFV